MKRAVRDDSHPTPDPPVVLLSWPCVGDPAQGGRLRQLLQRMGVLPRGIREDHRRTLAR